ncbi:ComEC/Rec2 family competence protein [Candidatus Saccharibacteria bacterium]|nr:ComEC/Rec2 family competence protein [Candidatus Saccharibacteria bacterium]
MMKNIHPSWAVVAAALGVIFGDISIHVFRYDFFGSLSWLFVALALLIFALKFPRKIFISLAFLAGVIFIAFRATPDFAAEKTLRAAVGHGISLTATVLKDPNIAEDKTTLILVNLKFAPASLPASTKPGISAQTSLAGKLFVSLPQNPKTESKIQRGDELTVEGELSEGFGTYAGFLYRPDILKHKKGNDAFLKIRDALADKIRQSLPEKESGLALGYLLGLKSGVDKDFEATLRVVGLTHIIVASGTHLSILASFARKIFGKATRFLGLLGASLLTLIFVGITGLTPSMSRAAPVALLSLLAWYLGRDRSPGRVLLAVAAGTLIAEPTNLLDLAWLLSFASFTGIMILAPIIKSFFYGAKKPGYLAELIIASLAATFACAPILLYFFGSISLISIFANLLILPTISVVMGLTLLTGLLNLVALAPLAGASAFLAKILLDYHFAVVNFLGDQKFFLVGAPSGVASLSGSTTGIFAGSPFVFLLYIPLIALVLVATIRSSRRRRVLTI